MTMPLLFMNIFTLPTFNQDGLNLFDVGQKQKYPNFIPETMQWLRND
jgi:hypothetical protein